VMEKPVRNFSVVQNYRTCNFAENVLFAGDASEGIIGFSGYYTKSLSFFITFSIQFSRFTGKSYSTLRSVLRG